MFLCYDKLKVSISKSYLFILDDNWTKFQNRIFQCSFQLSALASSSSSMLIMWHFTLPLSGGMVYLVSGWKHILYTRLWKREPWGSVSLGKRNTLLWKGNGNFGFKFFAFYYKLCVLKVHSQVLDNFWQLKPL